MHQCIAVTCVRKFASAASNHKHNARKTNLADMRTARKHNPLEGSFSLSSFLRFSFPPTTPPKPPHNAYKQTQQTKQARKPREGTKTSKVFRSPAFHPLPFTLQLPSPSSVSMLTTFPSVSSDLLMKPPSICRCPWVLASRTLSEPARSTRLRVLITLRELWLERLRLSITMRKMVCEREEFCGVGGRLGGREGRRERGVGGWEGQNKRGESQGGDGSAR